MSSLWHPEEWLEYGEIVVPPCVNGLWKSSRITAVPDWRSMRKGERETHSETVCWKPRKLICHSAMILPRTSAHCRSSRAVQVNVAAAVSQIIGSNAWQRTERTARMNTFEVGLTQVGGCCPRDSVIAFASDNKSEEVTGDTRLSKGVEEASASEISMACIYISEAFVSSVCTVVMAIKIEECCFCKA